MAEVQKDAGSGVAGAESPPEHSASHERQVVLGTDLRKIMLRSGFDGDEPEKYRSDPGIWESDGKRFTLC